MSRAIWGLIFVAAVVSASGCSGETPAASKTVTETVTVTEPPSEADLSPEPAPAPVQEFIADEDAFYARAIKLDKSLADMSREVVTGYGWNLCQLETMVEMDDPNVNMNDPMFKNMLGPAKARGTLAAAHTYLCPDNG